MTDRDLLLKCLMGAALSAAQRETLQAYLMRIETGLPLSPLARRQIHSVAVAAKLVSAAPQMSRPKDNGSMYEDGTYCSKRSKGSDIGASVIASQVPSLGGRMPAPPGRRSA